MSSTASRTYAIGHVQVYPTFPYYGLGSESLTECLLTSGDGKYIVEEPSNLTHAALFAKPAFDSAIPTGVTLDSMTFTCKAARGSVTGVNSTCIGYGVRWGSGDDFQYELYPWDAVTFSNVMDYADRFNVKEWEDVSVTFTTDVAEGLSVDRIPEYYMGLKVLGGSVEGNEFLAFDYARVTFNFTFPTLILSNNSPTVYNTTPYKTDVSFIVPDIANIFNTFYPLTCWAEWTNVDPTNADVDTIPTETTPVQTFTATRNTADRDMIVYDTLPSPLDVQSEKGRLSPNTTYWVRGVASLNGEETRSGWTSFTTPKYDSVVL